MEPYNRKKRLRYSNDKPIGYNKKGWPIFGKNEDGKPICNASMAKGGRCQNPLLYPNGRCRVHGGPSTSKNPFLDARMRQDLYGKTLPKDTGLIFSDAFADPDILTMRSEIALNTVQIASLLAELSGKDGLDNDSWQEVLALAKKVEEGLFDPVVVGALAMPDGTKCAKFQDNIEKLLLRIKRGADKRKIHAEISAAVEFRRKLVETEQKLEDKKNTTIALSDAILLYRNLVSVIIKIFGGYEEEMVEFMAELDRSALNVAMSQQANLLGLKPAPSSLIKPESILSDDIEEHLAGVKLAEVAKELSETPEHKPLYGLGKKVGDALEEFEQYESDGEEILYEDRVDDEFHIQTSADLSDKLQKEEEIALKTNRRQIKFKLAKVLPLNE